MRVLFACSLGGLGHLVPLVQVAGAVERQSHEALLLVPPSLAGAAAGSGLAFQVGAEPPRSFIDDVWERVRVGPPDAVTGLIDRELFADRCTQTMLGPARALRDAWRPDRVVRDPCEYASGLAAHEAGIVHATAGISLSATEWDVLEMVEPIIDGIGSGLAPGIAAAVRAAPYLTSFPPSLDPSPWPDTRRFRQPLPGAGRLPDWWPGDGRPLVYATLGSVVGHLSEASAAFRAVLDAVARLPARVLLTTGRGVAVDRLGPLPGNVHAEQWVAQADVLAHASLVLCHGGSGTTFGALAAGVPLVICPLFADQSANGRLVAAAGAGRVVAGGDHGGGALRGLGPADVAPLRAAAEAVLGDDGYRRAAARLAEEMAQLPTLDAVVACWLDGAGR